MKNKIYDTINNISLLHWLFTIIPALTAFFSLLILIIFKNRRMLGNFQRPIKIFTRGKSNHSMEMEYQSLKKIGFFNLEKPVNDNRDLQNITNHSLIIIGYDKKMNFEDFEEIVKTTTSKNIPLIIYTFGDNEILVDKHWDILNKHLWYSIANTPLRLSSDVFTSLSTFPYEQSSNK